MSCKPMTKKEWVASVNEMWKSAVEFAHKDLIDEAVKAEREACAKICDGMDSISDYYTLRVELICANAIRARGQE